MRACIDYEAPHQTARVAFQPKRYKVYEKNGTLRISVAAVKNIGEAKRALEGVVGVSSVA